jgi:uncharacterized SAM-binding protein YcdF (DUF218 family)
MKYNAIVVLGHELTKEKKLTETGRERIDLGIDLIKKGFADKLIVSGGHEDFGECYGISVARVLKNYSIKKGVPEQDIIEEDISWETAGELIFIKQGIIDPRKWKNILIITHDWHMNRTEKESRFIFGEDYNLYFKSVKSPNPPLRSREQEEKSYQTFLETFDGIKPGEDKRILERLVTKHRFYSQRKEYTLTKLKTLINQKTRIF